MKRCSKCKETKSLDSFNFVRLSKKTGEPLFRSHCDSCRSEYSKKRYRDNKEVRRLAIERSKRFWKEQPERAREIEKKRRESYSKGVYQITNTVTGSAYVGSSSAIEERWRHHKSRLKRGIHHSKRFQMDYNIYGEDSFVFEIIKESQESVDKLRLLERETIINLEVSGVRLYNKAYTVPKRKVVITIAR